MTLEVVNIPDAKIDVGDRESGQVAKPCRLRVAFMPFNRENQYWQQLADHLGREGISVCERGMLKGLIGEVLSGKCDHDILHIQWMPTFDWTLAGLRRHPSFILHLAVLRLIGHRIVWTAHDLYHGEVRWRLADRVGVTFATPFVSRIIAHTETAKRIVCREFAILRRGKVVVVPHGNYIDSYENTVSRERAREQLGIRGDPIVFLFLGHIRAYKGVADLIRSFENMEDSNRLLVIAGKPKDAETMPRLNALVRDPERIRMHAEFLPDEQIQVYLNAADVMVMPYRQGLTSGAVVLGMSFGRACIAAAIGSIPDMLDEKGSFLYDPDAPGGLLGALNAAAREKSRLCEMGKFNFERAKAWSWAQVATQTADVYRKVAGAK